MKYLFGLDRLVISAMFITLVGCASPSQPTRFYRLESGRAIAETVDLKPRSGIAQIGVSPVVLSGYLDRPQIVERSSGHLLTLYDFDQWAGSLQDNLQAVMTNALQQQLQGMQVFAYPWHQSLDPQYELNLSISRFDRVGETIVLRALWSLLERRDNQIVEMQQMTLQEPVSDEGVEAGVDAAERVVGRLVEHMANLINRDLKQVVPTE